jgi:membrane protein implicated in regulation of membrane protease activity
MGTLLTEWWFWISAAAVLGIVEVLVPAFVFLGFSVGALAVGLLLLTGLVGLSPAGNIALFAVLSFVGYAALRAFLGRSRGDIRIVEKDINDN